MLRAPSESEAELKADYELMAFRQAAQQAAMRGERLWIVKPARSSRGRGIRVFDSVKAVEAFLKRRKHDSIWVSAESHACVLTPLSPPSVRRELAVPQTSSA